MSKKTISGILNDLLWKDIGFEEAEAAIQSLLDARCNEGTIRNRVYMKAERVTFDAFRTDKGTGPLDLRIVIPKKEYQIVAEDNGYYYLQPVDAFLEHVAVEGVSKDNG